MSAPRNRLLALMQATDRERLLPHLEPITVERGTVVIHAGAPLVHAYFPEDGLSSNIARGGDRRAIEVGCFGYEGMVSSASLLGCDEAPHEIVAQVGGTWLRIGADRLKAAIRESAALQALLLRYVHIQILTLSQTALSNGAYSIEERLARWLLMAHDRLGGDGLPLTHDFLSVMLGVQRSSVTLATQSLEGYGMIRARRGLITVLDPAALERLAGETYGPAESAYERLIGPFRRRALGSE